MQKKVIKRNWKFVGLSYFVKTWLGDKLYDYNSSFFQINRLADKGIVRFEKVQSPETDNMTTIISLRDEKQMRSKL